MTGIFLKYSIVADIRLVPEDEEITDQGHHSDHSVDQYIERHSHKGNPGQSMLDAAVQQSRRYQGCRLITQNRYKPDNRFHSKTDSSSRKNENGVEQTTDKFYEGIGTRILPCPILPGQNFDFDIFGRFGRLLRLHNLERELGPGDL